MKVLALVGLLLSTISAFCQQATPPPPGCVVTFTVATQDSLKNLKMGLLPKDVEWVNKLQEKYPGVCYVGPSKTPHAVLLIAITPDTYHGERTVTDTATTTSDTDSTVRYTTRSEHQQPYSVEYGIYTLMVERTHPDGSLTTLQTFQQKGLYYQISGIPLGGRGHHPAHAVIEDAIKWLSAGGLSDPTQGSSLVPKTVP
jgi:hypothetical protein